MNPETKPVSPLRQRMIDDMRMRKLSPKTQDGYLRSVSRFASFLHRSPDTATDEDCRRYQLYLVDCGISAISLNATITALTFFFKTTLSRPDLISKMHYVHAPRKLPVLLSPEEVRRLIRSAGCERDQTALAVAYGAGLRVGEVCSLKISDIDSQRMTLRIEQGKGQKKRTNRFKVFDIRRVLLFVARP